MSFCVAIAVVTVVVFFLGDVRETESAGIAATLVVAAGAVSLVAGRLARRRLDGSSDAVLLTSYQSRFFLRVAFAEAAALAGFVIAVSVGPWWVYFVGLAFAIVGLIRVAPTVRNLERDDNDLHAQGCHRSISRVLNSTFTSPTR